MIEKHLSYAPLSAEMVRSVEGVLHFAHERESIRLRRELGEPAPWTSDPVLGAVVHYFRR